MSGPGASIIQRGGWWVLGQQVLLLAVVIGSVLWHGASRGLLILGCGALLLLVAAACGIAGLFALGRNLTPFPKPSPNARLVQRGVYGLVRHPLYTALICGSVGWAMVWGSWPALIAALALALFLDAKARREERWLRQQFPEYADYERRVGRFIPGVY